MTDVEYEEMAIEVIRNYINKDFSNLYIKNKFGMAIKRLVANAKSFDSAKLVPGISQITQESQSISFKSGAEAWTITDDIKLLLPVPYVKMY